MAKQDRVPQIEAAVALARRRAYFVKLSKQGVDERGDSRALRKRDEHAEAEKENNHRHEPPKFALPKKLQQLGSNTESP
jgi:hypothetical protein